MAVLCQAFPYTPIANPLRFVPDRAFGIGDQHMQAVVDNLRETGKLNTPKLVNVAGSAGVEDYVRGQARLQASTIGWPLCSPNPPHQWGGHGRVMSG